MNRIPRRTFLATSALAVGAVAAQAEPAAPTAPAIDPLKPGRTPHTKFAVNLEMWWTSLPFLERIQKAAELGFPAFEFWPYEGKDLEGIARLCGDLGIVASQFTAWGFKPGLNDPQNHEAFVRKIEEACQVAKRLNVKKMCVVGGDDQPGMTQAQMHDNIIAGLKKVVPIVEKHEVMLILEAMNIRVDHKGHCLYGSAPTLRIVRAVNSPMVKINWDLYHMHISEGDLCGHLREGFDQVGYLQVADHPGRNEPGTGEINYSRVLREAYDLGYRDYVGLELRPKSSELAAAQAAAHADIW